ncbi:MAG: TRAP transporter substrate-binding protein [Desulfobacteraceae bacterium]|nr:TRAP transporter substrate-binding protein [Desulfobacteraceae bacterium]
MAYPSKLPGLGTTISWMADRVKLLSNDSLEIKIYEPGKLVPSFEMLDAVSQGKVNACYGVSGYWAGKFPAADFFTAVPFGPECTEYLAWIYYGNGMKLWQQMYDSNKMNVKAFLCGVLPPETSGWYVKEIKTIEDYKGLPVRFFGLGGKVLQKLGASVSLLPGGEIFAALEKKAIEAAEFSMPAIDSTLGFHKIAKYNYFPGWHQQATLFELLINKNTWNGMSERQKLVIETLCRASTLNTIAWTESLQYSAMRRNAEKNGVKNMYLTDEILAKLRVAWEQIAEEQSWKDEFFSTVWQDLQNFRSEYKIWKDYGFLPRPRPSEIQPL